MPDRTAPAPAPRRPAARRSGAGRISPGPARPARRRAPRRPRSGLPSRAPLNRRRSIVRTQWCTPRHGGRHASGSTLGTGETGSRLTRAVLAGVVAVSHRRPASSASRGSRSSSRSAPWRWSWTRSTGTSRAAPTPRPRSARGSTWRSTRFLIAVLSVHVAPYLGLVGARHRRDALRLRRRRPCAAVAPAPGAPALLGQGGRRDPGHRADRRRLASAARSGGSRSSSPSRCCCWWSRSGTTSGGSGGTVATTGGGTGGPRVPSGAPAWAVTVAAVVVLWIALAPPRVADGLGLGDLLRIPVEGLVLVGVALALPASAATDRRRGPGTRRRRPRRAARARPRLRPLPGPAVPLLGDWSYLPRDSRWCGTPTAAPPRRCCSQCARGADGRAGRVCCPGPRCG